MNLALFALTFLATLGGPRTLTVAPGGDASTITAALALAQAGDTIRVVGGVHRVNLVVDKAVTLEGVDWPVLDGGGAGTVVLLKAPGCTLRGFEVRGSGVEPDLDHSGVTITADDVRVEHNRLRDVLFGIFVSRADRAVVKDNDVGGKQQFDAGRRGDAIRLWYSADVQIEDNLVQHSRDTVIWYSKNCSVRGNRIESGRYGIHLMYTDDVDIERNVLRGNAVGIYVMYSSGVTMRNNDIRDHRGPSGYALGFKDADRVTVTNNLLIDNRAGVFSEGTPFTPGGFARFERNIVAFNELAVSLAPSTRGASFHANTFWENAEQVSVAGAGPLGTVRWEGNYWSDATGFDLDGDGYHDQPYQADKLFEGLTDREPALRVLLYSPAAQALEMAGAAFPVVRPQPKLLDPHPAAEPLRLELQELSNASPRSGLLWAGTLLLSFFFVTSLGSWRRSPR